MEPDDAVSAVAAWLALSRAVEDVKGAFRGATVHVAGLTICDILQGRAPDRIRLLISGMPSAAVLDALKTMQFRRGGASAAIMASSDASWIYTYLDPTDRIHAVEVASLDLLVERMGEGGTTSSSIDEYLSGQMFTAEAIAVELWSGTLSDPCNGLDDIRNRRLAIRSASLVGGAPLWPLRAAIIVAQTGLVADDALTQRMRADAGGLLDHIDHATSRVVLSALMAGHHAAAAVGLVRATGVLEYLLPQLGSASWQGDADVALDELTAIEQRTHDPSVRMAALLAAVGASGARSDLELAGFPKAYVDRVCALIAGGHPG